MVGIYFFGTGNTKYILELFLKKLYKEYTICSIEEKCAIEQLKQAKEITIAYPIYYSSLPKIVSDFIDTNIELFREKRRKYLLYLQWDCFQVMELVLQKESLKK